MPRGFSLAAVTLAVLAAPFAAAADASPALSGRQTLSLPAQPLGQTLNALARQSGTAISVDAALIAGRRAPALQGTMTLGEALRQALAGSGLLATPAGTGISVHSGDRAGEVALPEVTVSASTGRSAVTEGKGSYTTGSMSTATRLPLSIRETPQAVTVMTRQQLNDQAMTSITDVVRNAPGLFLSTSNGPGRPDFSARGFSVDNAMYDGLPSSYQGWIVGAQANMAMFDRVEIVRGATGLVSGSGTPSAAINLVRKRPTAAPKLSLTGSVGSWDNYRGEIDASGSLNENGTVRARVVGSWQDAHTFRDVEAYDHGLFYAVGEADLGERTLLTVGASYQKDSTNNFWGGLPLTVTGGHMNLPRSTFPGNAWERKEQKITTVFGEFRHQFDNDWSVRLAAMQAWQDAVFSGTYLVRSSPTDLGHNAYQSGHDEDQSSYDLYASGPFALLGRSHELMGGISRRQTRLATDNYSGNGMISQHVDPFSWDPHSVPKPHFVYTDTSHEVTTQEGIYLGTRLSLADPLKLILGARLDWYDYEGRSEASDYKVTRNLTRYAGLIYDLDRRHSVYASYTDIFTPQTSKDTSGRILDPIVGENYEIGIKGEYFGGALNAAVALFQIEQKNRARLNSDQSLCPTFPATSCYQASGLVRSRGIDVEIQGALTPGWQLSAGYTYTRANYIRDSDPANEGKRFNPDMPQNLFKLSTVYTLPGDLNQWRVGGTLYWQSDIFNEGSYEGVDFRNEQKAYAVADLMLGYRVNRHLDLQLNINNVFDKTYYKAVGSDVTWGPTDSYGDPRNAMLTARYVF